MDKPSFAELLSMTRAQRIARAALYSVTVLKAESAARSAAARIKPGEQRASKQYNTDDYDHKGNGQRSTIEAARIHSVNKNEVAKAITVMNRQPELFKAMQEGCVTFGAACKNAFELPLNQLSAVTKYDTINVLRRFLEDGWDTANKLGYRRCPSHAWIKAEGANVKLFTSLWGPALKAVDKGKLSEFLDATMSLL
jgi:hypothetical protein